MRKVLKRVAAIFLIPLTKWYLRKERHYSYQGINITVLPGVFHPGIFHSTSLILKYLNEQDLANKKVIEIGSGTGLISIRAAKANASVTATDLSLTAIKNTALNADLNKARIRIIHSDLFTNVEKTVFDWIIINPPYYDKDPKKDEELAWYCGKNFEYFQKLFTQLKSFMSPSTEVIMVLTKGCDLKKIFELGNIAEFKFELLKENDVFFDEKDYLYRIKSKAFELSQA
jgi:release factor glutamine methyltransferase